MNYSEYIAENMDNMIDYNKYLADNLDKMINYSEYIASSLMDQIDYKSIERRKKIKKIKNKLENLNKNVNFD